MAIIDKIQLSGTVYTIGNETTTAVTSASTDNEIPTAKAVYDAIPQGGGGKAIEAGRGISITTGDTADTVSFNLPISAGTTTTSIIVGNKNNTASGSRSFAGGEGCTASSTDSFAFGLANTASSTGATAFGFKTKADVNSSFVCGKWNDIANANTGENFGDSGNTLFAVGNGWASNDWLNPKPTKHNAFEIRQNGDIYIADTNDTSTSNFYEKPMIKLQDALGGGGGSSYTAGDGIDITNDVISVTGKVDTSTYETYTAATDTALASKQTTLTAGTGISIVDNVISATGGGGSITIDQSLDSSSTNPVANSAITNAINSKENHLTNYLETWTIYKNYSRGCNALYFTYRHNDNEVTGWFPFANINGKSVESENNFSLVETSAITTSVTSSSTDAQVPSAKAVYDMVGNINTILESI